MKYLLLALYVLSILALGFIPAQEDFAFLLPLFIMGFATYFYLIHKGKFDFKVLLFIALGLRIVMLFSFPNLSDDIYRFVWDGKLIHDGISPYQYLPKQILELEIGTSYSQLYEQLNSQEYYSVYPPFAQAIFYLSSFPAIKSLFYSVLIIKLLLLVAECITAFFLIKILKILKLRFSKAFWYLMNPLVIVEIMGNVHFEGFMVTFFVLFLYFLLKTKVIPASIAICLSISAKLVPLIFLPYFLFRWKMKQSFLFFFAVGLLLIPMFSPVIIQLSGFGQSLDLYFRKFEFNASVYYILRWFGELIYGYNPISKLGPALGFLTLFGIFWKAYQSKIGFQQFCDFALTAILIYLMLSTTVHPWYLCLGILLGVFTRSKIFVVWSLLIVLSYSKYALGDGFHLFLVLLEYSLLFAYIIYEVILDKNWKVLTEAKTI